MVELSWLKPQRHSSKPQNNIVIPNGKLVPPDLKKTHAQEVEGGCYFLDTPNKLITVIGGICN